ncbi:MAG: hypothetical protein NDJ89_11795 [Oligoflexia bacterium]|nr:hypothetical protein [Oligoflexia bacterium]
MPKSFWILTLGLILAAGNALAGSLYEELDAAQKSLLQAGQPVTVLREAPGSVWPSVQVYQRVESTSEEAMAVFADFARHRLYLPDVTRSDVSAVLNPRTVIVDYTVNLPWPLSNKNHTTRNVLSASGQDYRLDWVIVRAEAAKSGVGIVRSEPLGTGALVSYSTSVVPKSDSAGLVKGRAIEMVRKTVAALVREIERVRGRDRALLQEQLGRLRRALD